MSASSRRQLDAAQFDGYIDIARHAATPTGERETRALRSKALARGDYVLASYLDGCFTIAAGMKSTHARINQEVRARTSSDGEPGRR